MIISLTTNFIAAFHGLYLLAAHSHSPQLFLFSFWTEHVEKSLKTMSNKRCCCIPRLSLNKTRTVIS